MYLVLPSSINWTGEKAWKMTSIRLTKYFCLLFLPYSLLKLGTLRFTTVRRLRYSCNDMRSIKSLLVMSPPGLQYGFPAGSRLVVWYSWLLTTFSGTRKQGYSRCRESRTSARVVMSLEVILTSCYHSTMYLTPLHSESYSPYYFLHNTHKNFVHVFSVIVILKYQIHTL